MVAFYFRTLKRRMPPKSTAPPMSAYFTVLSAGLVTGAVTLGVADHGLTPLIFPPTPLPISSTNVFATSGPVGVTHALVADVVERGGKGSGRRPSNPGGRSSPDRCWRPSVARTDCCPWLMVIGDGHTAAATECAASRRSLSIFVLRVFTEVANDPGTVSSL